MRGNMELLKYLKMRLQKCLSALCYRGVHLQWNAAHDR